MRTLRLHHHRPAAILAITATLLTAASLSAPAVAQNQTGSIRVLVQIQGTSEPIAGAQVILTGPPVAGAPPATAGTVVNVVTATSPFGPSVTGGSVGAGFTSTVITDAAGLATFDKVPPGRYSVRAQRDGYLQPSGAGMIPAYAAATVLANQPSPTAVTLALATAGSISGRVRDASGLPLPNARVYASTLGYRDGSPVLLPGPNAQPDGQGNYRLTPLAPGGAYYVKVEPLALRGVGAFYPGVVNVENATLVPIQADQEVVGVDFDVPSLPTFKISGKMLNVPPRPQAANGLQVPNGILGFTFAPADPRNPDWGNAPLLQSASRGANGEFEISLPAGDWAVYPVIPISAPGSAPAFGQSVPTYATGRARILVADRNIEDVTITIGASDIKVRLTGAPSGTSIARMTLVPRENIPSPLISHLRNGQTLTADGEIEFKSVPPGKYSLQIPSQPNSYVADLRVGSKSVLEDGIITVGLDPLEPVEVVLREGGGTVQGTVTMPGPVAITDTVQSRIVLVPDLAQRRGNPFFYKTVVLLDPLNGSFTLRAVPPGDYKLFAFQSLPAGGAEQDETFMAKYEGFGTPVKVIDGQTSNVAIRWILKD